MNGKEHPDFMDCVCRELLEGHCLSALACLLEYAGGEVEARYRDKGVLFSCWDGVPKAWPEKCLVSWGDECWFFGSVRELLQNARFDGMPLWALWEEMTDLQIV